MGKKNLLGLNKSIQRSENLSSRAKEELKSARIPETEKEFKLLVKQFELERKSDREISELSGLVGKITVNNSTSFSKFKPRKINFDAPKDPTLGDSIRKELDSKTYNSFFKDADNYTKTRPNSPINVDEKENTGNEIFDYATKPAECKL